MLLSYFCPSCACLLERATVKTRFYGPKRLSILSSLTLSGVLNVPCTQSDQILTQTNISIRNIWVTEATIVVDLSGDGDLQSEISLQYKHQLN